MQRAVRAQDAELREAVARAVQQQDAAVRRLQQELRSAKGQNLQDFKKLSLRGDER